MSPTKRKAAGKPISTGDGPSLPLQKPDPGHRVKVNFWAPAHLVEAFIALCNEEGKSQTQKHIELMSLAVTRII